MAEAEARVTTAKQARDEADAQLLADRQDLRLRSAPEHGVLVLDRRERLFRMGTAKGLRARFRETPVKELALGHQILDRAGDILDRHLRIDTVLIDEVDTIGSQAPQHALDRPRLM